jgi:hypothetical protein
MGVHANARLGPAGRRELVRLIREGEREAGGRLPLGCAGDRASLVGARARSHRVQNGLQAPGRWIARARRPSPRINVAPLKTPVDVERNTRHPSAGPGSQHLKFHLAPGVRQA